MYGKIFEDIFDSTLVAEGGWLPTYIFMSMITLANRHGVVSVAAKALYRRIGLDQADPAIPYTLFEKALAYLEAPDEDSRTLAQEGRRIIPLQEIEDLEGNRGWWLVNYDQYAKKGGKEAAGASTRRVRAHRERQKQKQAGKDVTADVTVGNENETEGNAETAGNGNVDIDIDVDKEKNTTVLPSNPDGSDQGENTAPEKKEETPTPEGKEKKPEFPQWFEVLWESRPSRGSAGNPKKKCLSACNARLKAGHTKEEFTSGLKRYVKYHELRGSLGTEFVQMMATFFGPGLGFMESWELDPGADDEFYGEL